MFDVRLGFLALLVSGGIIFARPEAKNCPYVIELEKKLAELEKLPARIDALEKEVTRLKEQGAVFSKLRNMPHKGRHRSSRP